MVAAIANCRNSTSCLLLCSSPTGHVGSTFMLCHMTPQLHKTSLEHYAAQRRSGCALQHHRKKVVGWIFDSGTLCAEFACSAGGCEASHQVLALKDVRHKHQANGPIGNPELVRMVVGLCGLRADSHRPHRFPSNSRRSTKLRL